MLFKMESFRLWLNFGFEELVNIEHVNLKSDFLDTIYQFVKSEFGIQQILSNLDSIK